MSDIEKAQGREYKRIIDNLKEMIAVIQNEKIVFFNESFLENTRITKENINDIEWNNLIDKVSNKKEIENIKFNKEFIEPFQFKLNIKNGNEKWFEVSTQNFIWENKEAVLCTFNDVTLKKIYEEQLKRSEKSKEALIKSMNDLIIVLDLNYKFKEYYTPNPEELYINPEYFIGKSFRDIEFPEEARGIILKALDKLTENKKSQETEYVIPTENGSKWYNLHITLIDDTYSKEKNILCVARDISKLKESENKLRIKRERLKNIIEGTNVGTWELNLKTKDITINDRWAEMLGYTKKELEPLSIEHWKKIIHPDDLESTLDKVRKHIEGKIEYFEQEYRIKNKKGEYIWILSRGKVISWKERLGGEQESRIIFGTNQDITDRKKIDEKILELSIRDPLTNLYNRRYIFDRLKEIQGKYMRNKEAFSVSIIDIDFFKRINDEFGHLAGDYVLQEFSKLLQNSLRSIDLVGRYGGEEFIIIMTDCVKQDAEKRINLILEKIRKILFVYSNHHIKFTFTAGIADSNDFEIDNINLDKLVDTADKRLYKGKQSGRNRIEINSEIE